MSMKKTDTPYDIGTFFGPPPHSIALDCLHCTLVWEGLCCKSFTGLWLAASCAGNSMLPCPYNFVQSVLCLVCSVQCAVCSVQCPVSSV